jgi:hypothetical protein
MNPLSVLSQCSASDAVTAISTDGNPSGLYLAEEGISLNSGTGGNPCGGIPASFPAGQRSFVGGTTDTATGLTETTPNFTAPSGSSIDWRIQWG